jgi:hypothetical protein
MKNEYEDEKDDQDGQVGSGEEGKGGQTGGGQTGKIHFRFRDAASLPPRDDVLPPNEIKRLLIIHNDIHKNYVDKQKQTRKERAALKKGKKHLMGHQQIRGTHGGGASKYKKHPISNKAQFSGIDKQIIGIPTEFSAETNLEMQEKLENRFVNRQVPRFHPKPQRNG